MEMEKIMTSYRSREKRLNVLRAREEFERRCRKIVEGLVARGEVPDYHRAPEITRRALEQPSYFYVSSETAYARMLRMVGAGGRRHGKASGSARSTSSTDAMWQEMAGKVRHRLESGGCHTLRSALGDTLNYDRASQIFMPYDKALRICRKVILSRPDPYHRDGRTFNY